MFSATAVQSAAEQRRGRRGRQIAAAAAAPVSPVGRNGGAFTRAGGASGQAQEHGQQKGTAAHAEHQQRVLRSPGLHTQRAVRHEVVENQNAPAGHVLHRLPDDRAGQRRPGHGRFQSRPVRAHVQAVFHRAQDYPAPGTVPHNVYLIYCVRLKGAFRMGMCGVGEYTTLLVLCIKTKRV